MNTTETIAEELKEASKGLLFPSESEYPFEVLVWEHKGPDSPGMQEIRELSGHNDLAEITVSDPDYFFRNVAEPREWHDEGQAATVARFSRLRRLVKDRLRDVKVYRIGKIDIDVYIAGRSDEEHIVALKTKVIET